MSTNFSGVRVRVSLVVLLLIAGIGTVFYFSWLPEPVLSKSSLLPNWLARWADASENDTIRTAVPFTCLGLIIGGYLAVTFRKWPWWLSSWAGLVLIVFIAEAGQLMIPHRNFDWADITWGTVGSLSGLIIMGLGFLLIRNLKKLRS